MPGGPRRSNDKYAACGPDINPTTAASGVTATICHGNQEGSYGDLADAKRRRVHFTLGQSPVVADGP